MTNPHKSLFMIEEQEFRYRARVENARLTGQGYRIVSRPGFCFAKRKHRLIPLDHFLKRIQKRVFKGEKRCTYCDNTVSWNGKTSLKRATIEHLQPISLGGTWKRCNLRIACESCNSTKSNLTEADFRGLVAQYGARNVRPHAKELAQQRQREREQSISEGRFSR